MIDYTYDKQKVIATKELYWVAQRVFPGAAGTIYWKWVWIRNSKLIDRATKIKRYNTFWGFWAPVIVWQGRRNKSGYECVIKDFNGLVKQ